MKMEYMPIVAFLCTIQAIHSMQTQKPMPVINITVNTDSQGSGTPLPAPESLAFRSVKFVAKTVCFACRHPFLTVGVTTIGLAACPPLRRFVFRNTIGRANDWARGAMRNWLLGGMPQQVDAINDQLGQLDRNVQTTNTRTEDIRRIVDDILTRTTRLEGITSNTLAGINRTEGKVDEIRTTQNQNNQTIHTFFSRLFQRLGIEPRDPANTPSAPVQPVTQIIPLATQQRQDAAMTTGAAARITTARAATIFANSRIDQ